MKRFATIAALLFAAAILIGFTGCKKEPEINYYTVSFNTDGAGDIASQKVAEGKVAAKPEDPAKTGYTFCGWYNGETAFDFAAPITADTNLKAKWTIITFTVTFNTDGGSEAPATQTVNYGSTVQKPADPTKEGYGSYDWMNGEEVFDFTSTVTSDLLLKVKWYVGTKKPNEAKEVGDIVFNEGSAIAYDDFKDFEQETIDAVKTSAIALIFYKGTGLNNGNDTTTTRTLGVGLIHGSGLQWSATGGNAKTIQITDIMCVPSGGTGAANFVFEGEGIDRNGSDNFEQIGAFLSDPNKGNSTDDTTIEGADQKYSVFYWCKQYKNNKVDSETTCRIISGSEYENGWYLPTIAELCEIYKNLKGTSINTVIEALGGDKFDTIPYWSSSQSNSTEYFDRLNFSNGSIDSSSKSTFITSKNVCCIREF